MTNIHVAFPPPKDESENLPGTNGKSDQRNRSNIFMLRKTVAFAVLIVSIVTCAFAQSNPISFSIKSNASSKALQPGDTFTVQVLARINDGWHLYSTAQPPGGPMATRILVPPNQFFKLAGPIRAPAPLTELDPNFKIETHFYEESAVFSLPVVVVASDSSSLGKQKLQVNVSFQTCNDRYCLPPQTVKLFATVEITPSPAELKNNETTPTQPATSTDSPAQEQPSAQPVTNEPSAPGPNSLQVGANRSEESARPNVLSLSSSGGSSSDLSFSAFLWLAMSLGALSLLTPCVFPMVPITVSYFTNKAAGGRLGAAREGLVYASGIVLTFTLVGIGLATMFGAAGINRFAASPWINLIVTGIFFSFALSLFGAFNLAVPSRLLTKLDSISRARESRKIIGILLMSFVFTLTSFTCTAPFVGTLLVMAARGEWIYPVAGMLAFSMVFALPFFVLAVAPQLVSRLPKSGSWLNSVKVVMGLLEIAAAMKFLSNVDLVWHWGIFSRQVVLASWVAILVLITLYLLGKFQLAHDVHVERIGALRFTIALISLAFGFYLLTGLFGRKVGELESFLPPAVEGPATMAVARTNQNTFATDAELSWITNDYQGALKQAKLENKPVFIDFTGYTCTNCRWMESNMFTKTPVKDELARYMRVRLFTDGEGQPYEGFQQMQQEKFGTVALPLYAVVNGNGDALVTFSGLTRNQSEFVSFLQQGFAKFNEETSK